MHESATHSSLLLTPKQAADVLAISARTLWNLTNSGAIRRVRIGRSVRYDVADLRAWIDSQKDKSRTAASRCSG